MSLRLRILLLIAAVNVGVLLLVVWLGLKAVETAEPVGPQALAEAWRAALTADSAAHGDWRAIRFVVRLPNRERADFQVLAPEEAAGEVEKTQEMLRRRLATRTEGASFDRHGLTVVNLSANAEWKAFHVAFNEVAHYEALAGLRRFYILLSAGTVLLILGTYLVLSRIVLRPLEQLVAASRGVAEGEPPAPVERPRGNDEVAKLVDNFNLMAREVHEYQQRLEERVLGALGRAKAAEGRLVVAQRLAATGTLAAGFAHEINNPLGGVLNALRRIREGNLSPEREDEYFELALDGLNRIRMIVERILHFTPRQQEPTSIDVADACRRAADLALHRAERRGVILEVSADKPVVGVVGDAQELQQAILNLLLNAVDAIPEGRPGTVSVAASREGTEVVVDVSDDGVGMDEETARRCVDLFYSTKAEGEGTGLGLAIVQHIVTDHGGTLDIESRPEEGTRVRIRLPVEDSG